MICDDQRLPTPRLSLISAGKNCRRPPAPGTKRRWKRRFLGMNLIMRELLMVEARA